MTYQDKFNARINLRAELLAIQLSKVNGIVSNSIKAMYGIHTNKLLYNKI